MGTAVAQRTNTGSGIGVPGINLGHIANSSSLGIVKADDRGKRPTLRQQMMNVARQYVQDSGLYNAILEVRDNAVVLTNAPFCGEAVLCGIENDRVVPYF